MNKRAASLLLSWTSIPSQQYLWTSQGRPHPNCHVPATHTRDLDGQGIPTAGEASLLLDPTVWCSRMRWSTSSERCYYGSHASEAPRPEAPTRISRTTGGSSDNSSPLLACTDRPERWLTEASPALAVYVWLLSGELTSSPCLPHHTISFLHKKPAVALYPTNLRS